MAFQHQISQPWEFGNDLLIWVIKPLYKNSIFQIVALYSLYCGDDRYTFRHYRIDVFSNLPERIEQWLEKETSATNQPETTEHRFVRPHWRMNRTLEYTVRISCLNCSHILKFKCHIVKYIRFGVDETTSSSDFFLLSRRGESDIARSDMEKRLECFQAEINANTQR